MFPFIPFWNTLIDGYDKDFSEVLRRMLKLKPNEAKILCSHLGCSTLNEFTTLLRHTKKIKEYILFDRDDLNFLRREH